VFAVPVETPGLRLISRQRYDDGTRNSFDHPLSAHFEETDSLVVANAMYVETNLGQHTGHQAGVRAPQRDLGPEMPRSCWSERGYV
jgi:anthranilate 3-monooxygenase (FAD)/4-hydroxyphenylacetate 3-monooxygenase